MSRLTDEQLKAWALPFSQADKGACDGVSDQLLTAHFARFDGVQPSSRKKKAVRIGHREKTSHTAIELHWASTDERVIVDATIRQFGGAEAVFVGSYEAWVGRLKQLTSEDRVVPVDADFGHLNDIADFLSAHDKEDLRRSSGSASGEIHKAHTVKKGCGGCTLL